NPANRDLAYLGVIGAVGDRHNRAGKLVGQNRLALEQAVALGDVHLEENNGQEQYWLTRFGDPLPLDTFWRSVTTLGAAGYYMGGPALGMQMCLAGPSPEVERKLAELSRLKEAAFSRTLDRLRQNGLWQTHYCQWFVVERDFEPMGVKMIGQFCEDIADEPFIDPHKYIVGFQIMPPETPGLGRFDWELYKVSMRVPAVLEHQILVEQSMPGLAAIVPPAAEAVGGSIDACHNYAAATVIDVDRATDLLAEMDRLVEVFKA
ncbi:MAG: phosphoesterase, partial [Chloroflexi bacterium]